MTVAIRLATPDDAGPILDIYRPFCEDSHVSFETQAPTPADMRHRIEKVLQRFPWLVGERAGTVLGYVYASPHRERAAYLWSVDVTVYIGDSARGAGLGRGLYTSLFRLLTLQGHCNAYAGTALPNPGSIGLHQAMGFTPVGTYQGVGFKAGKWHDVAWWQLPLQPHPAEPVAPLTLDQAQQLPMWSEALHAGLTCIHLC